MMNERKIFALGFFDGVHLGHQALLRACGDLAREKGISVEACKKRVQRAKEFLKKKI